MTDGRHTPACPRTDALIDHVVRDRVTATDLAHAGTCPDCRPVLARAARFDEELGRAARGFVTDELPRGVLDPALSDTVVGVTSARNGLPGLAGVLTAVAVLVLAMSVALLPGGLGGPSADPSGRPPGSGPLQSRPPASGPVATSPPRAAVKPALRSTAEIGGDLIGLDYLCQSGAPRETVGAGDGTVVRDGIVCYSPTSLTLTSVVVITGETTRRHVVEVAVKGQLVGADTDAARQQLAETMAKATFLVIGDAGTAPDAGDLVLASLPELQAAGEQATGTFGAVRVTLRRDASDSYSVLLQIVPGT